MNRLTEMNDRMSCTRSAIVNPFVHTMYALCSYFILMSITTFSGKELWLTIRKRRSFQLKSGYLAWQQYQQFELAKAERRN